MSERNAGSLLVVGRPTPEGPPIPDISYWISKDKDRVRACQLEQGEFLVTGVKSSRTVTTGLRPVHVSGPPAFNQPVGQPRMNESMTSTNSSGASSWMKWFGPSSTTWASPRAPGIRSVN
jgi:hypothetical protein